MIRYDVTDSVIKTLVNEIAPNWIADSVAVTQELETAGKYEEKTLSWGDVKPVFMSIQANKCIFCEQQMEGERIHHDLEHFRPKSSIKKWPKKEDRERIGIDTGDAEPTGYYWLAYNLQNYAAACKFCNTSLKSNSFPIRMTRTLQPNSVKELNKREKPYLCYPIGKIDFDPERLIEFDVTVAKPITQSGIKHDRAKIIIEFFGLNRRDSLHLDRAKLIHFLFKVLEDDDAEMTEFLLSDRSPHSSCLRSFNRMWNDNHAKAVEASSRCRDLVLSSLIADAPPLSV